MPSNLRLVKGGQSDVGGVGIAQPPQRTQTVWTPSKIRMAEQQAARGDLRLAGELCEWLLGDEQILRLAFARVDAVLSLEPTFEASGDKRRSARIVRSLEAGEDYWRGWPDAKLAEMMVWGILLGCSIVNQGWAENSDHGDRVLPILQVWSAQHCRHDAQASKWFARVARQGVAGDFGTEQEFTPGDGQWIVHAPFGSEQPYMRGLWRGLARWRLLRDYAISDWGKLGEGASRNVVEADIEASQYNTEEVRDEIANDLSSMGRDGTIVLPSGFSYKLVQSHAGASDIYRQQVALSEHAYAIAWRGGNLTTSTSGGSLAAAEVQERLGDDANKRSDAAALTKTVHDQSMTWWAEYNYGNAQLAPWPTYPVEPEEDLEKKATSESKAFEIVSKAEALGFDVDREKFLEEHNITWAKPGARPKPPEPKPVSADPAPTDDPESEPAPVAAPESLPN